LSCKCAISAVTARPGAAAVPRSPCSSDRLDHVRRDAHGLHGVGERAPDGLLDPPRRVRGKAAICGGIELLDRAHQAHVAFLDEVEQHQAAVAVALRDGHDEPQVRGRKMIAGLAVPALHLRGQLLLLVRGEQLHAIDLAQVDLD
jgi:hypothetical protein